MGTGQCATCKMPPELQEAIYDLHVRQDLNPLKTYQKFCQILRERGGEIKPPSQNAFFNHLKKHLDPEKTALVRIAKSQERAEGNRGGLRGVTITYLLDQFRQEKENRRKLQAVIDKIDMTIRQGTMIIMTKSGSHVEVELPPIDLSNLSKALGYLMKVQAEDRGLTELVESKVLEDMVSGIMNMSGRAMVNRMRTARDEICTIIKGAQKEELVAVLDRAMAGTLEDMEKVYDGAVEEIATMIKSKFKG